MKKPAHAFKALQEKDVEADKSIATLKKKTKKEEKLSQRKKQLQERDPEEMTTQRPQSELSTIIQPRLLHSEDANREDASLPLHQNKSVNGQKTASQWIASEPLHNGLPESTSIISDLPLIINNSWPWMGLRRPTLNTSSTNANTLPLTSASGLAFNVFPTDVKGLPTLKILGTTDPAGELKYKVYGTKFHCQWRVLVHHNARGPLDFKCANDNLLGKWAEGEKWIKDDITIMRMYDDKSEQRVEGLSDRRFELPLDLFKDKRPNEDGSISYRFPQQFRIDVEIEPLSAYDPLGMNRPENLSVTANDAIRNGSATSSQVRMVATAVVHSENAAHVVECAIRTYLTDISTSAENMSAEACRTERMNRCNEAFRTTQCLTPFKLAIAIEWPSCCKQPELASSLGEKDMSVALQQQQENCAGAEVEVPDSVWPKAVVKSTGSRALSQNAIIPAAESDMRAVSGTFLSTSQYDRTAPPDKNGRNSPRKKSVAATARPAKTITIKKDIVKASGTSQGAEALLSTIENVLDKPRLDDVEHNAAWAPGEDMPDVVTQSLDSLTLSPLVVDGPQVCDLPHANGDGMGLPVPTSRLLGLGTAVKGGTFKPTQECAPILQPGTIAHPAALASPHITEMPWHGKKKPFGPPAEIKLTGLRKGIRTLQQRSVDGAKSDEIIGLVSSDDEATVLSTKANGKNGIPRSSQMVKRSQTGNSSASSNDPPKQISGYTLSSEFLNRPFVPSPTKPSSAQNPSSGMPTHETLKSTDLKSVPLAKMPSAASNLSSNGEMPNGPTWIDSDNLPDKYGHHSRKELPSSNIVTVEPRAALRASGKQLPRFVPCYWIVFDEKGHVTNKKLEIAQCHICKVTFLEFSELRDHLESVGSHPDTSIKIWYDKKGNKCNITVRLSLVGDPPYVEDMFNEDTQNSKGVSGLSRRSAKPSWSVSSTPSVADAADNDNGRDELVDDDDDEEKRYISNRPATYEPNSSTESSALDSRGKSREKSPNPQPRKKRRKTNDIEADIAQDIPLACEWNSASSWKQAVSNVEDCPKVAPPGGLGMSAPSKSQSSNARRLENDELGPEHDQKHTRLDGDASRAKTLSKEHSQQAADRNTHIAQKPVVAESSTEWQSPQPSHPKKAKQANGPCFECKTILSAWGWHHKLPHQKRRNDGAVWCRNCYARHYNRLERDGGPCFLCKKTRSKMWHYKLRGEKRHDDGRMFCSKCYYKKSAKRKTIILSDKNPDSASSEHEVALRTYDHA